MVARKRIYGKDSITKVFFTNKKVAVDGVNVFLGKALAPATADTKREYVCAR